MLNSFTILNAMRGIRGKDVFDTQTFLGYMEKSKTQNGRGSSARKRPIKRMLLIAAIIVLILSLVACAVYLTHWSKGLDHQINATEDEKIAAEESGLSAYPEGANNENETPSITAGGVTITAEQTIVDNYFALIALRIEGYDVPDGSYPDLGVPMVTIGGENVHSMGGSFSESPSDNGTLEYDIAITNDSGPGYFNGKEISIVINGLGVGDKGRYTPVIEETWELKWTLKGSSEIRTVTVGMEIGDTGVVLVEAELSPISLHLIYKTNGEWEGHETMERFDPMVVGFRLKDGTVKLKTFGFGGYEGYLNLENFLYEKLVDTAVIVQPNEVDALLFSHKNPWAQELTEADIYTVPLT